MKLRIAILGPTCSGKSAIALKLAEQINAEIISCDSMQVYRGMDIGTAKPNLIDCQKSKHHLIDILDISQPYNVNKFIELCNNVLYCSNSSNKPIILVGGTGLYAKSLIYRYKFKAADPNLYSKLYQQAQTTAGYNSLYCELFSKYPALANSLKMNIRRLVRAVEIMQMSDDKPTCNDSIKMRNHSLNWFQIILIPDKEALWKAIRFRTSFMIKRGWVEETRLLLDKGLQSTPTARQALGYMEIASYLTGQRKYGFRDLETILQQKTLQYAKRQITWFKYQHPGAVFLSCMTPDKNTAWICDQFKYWRYQ